MADEPRDPTYWYPDEDEAARRSEAVPKEAAEPAAPQTPVEPAGTTTPDEGVEPEEPRAEQAPGSEEREPADTGTEATPELPLEPPVEPDARHQPPDGGMEPENGPDRFFHQGRNPVAPADVQEFVGANRFLPFPGHVEEDERTLRVLMYLALDRFPRMALDSAALPRNAARFSRNVFRARFLAALDTARAGRASARDARIHGPESV